MAVSAGTLRFFFVRGDNTIFGDKDLQKETQGHSVSSLTIRGCLDANSPTGLAIRGGTRDCCLPEHLLALLVAPILNSEPKPQVRCCRR